VESRRNTKPSLTKLSTETPHFIRQPQLPTPHVTIKLLRRTVGTR
jgi:hypothetical protein